MNTMGNKIKENREKSKITKSELARMIGVSPAYITMLENGKKDNPSGDILRKISNALNVPLDELLETNQSGEKAVTSFAGMSSKSLLDLIDMILDESISDKKISNVKEKINNGKELTEDDISVIINNRNRKIVENDFGVEGVPCVMGHEKESYELFKKLMISLGYTSEEIGTSQVYLFNKIKRQIQLEIDMLNER